VPSVEGTKQLLRDIHRKGKQGSISIAAKGGPKDVCPTQRNETNNAPRSNGKRSDPTTSKLAKWKKGGRRHFSKKTSEETAAGESRAMVAKDIIPAGLGRGDGGLSSPPGSEKIASRPLTEGTWRSLLVVKGIIALIKKTRKEELTEFGK